LPALSSTLHEHIDITTLILMLVLMLVAPAITDFDARPPPRATIACDAVMMMNFRIERDYPKLLLNAKNLVLCTYVTLPKVGGSDQDEMRRSSSILQPPLTTSYSVTKPTVVVDGQNLLCFRGAALSPRGLQSRGMWHWHQCGPSRTCSAILHVQWWQRSLRQPTNDAYRSLLAIVA
jgi:hypothetical protein